MRLRTLVEFLLLGISATGFVISAKMLHDTLIDRCAAEEAPEAIRLVADSAIRREIARVIGQASIFVTFLRAQYWKQRPGNTPSDLVLLGTFTLTSMTMLFTYNGLADQEARRQILAEVERLEH